MRFLRTLNWPRLIGLSAAVGVSGAFWFELARDGHELHALGLIVTVLVGVVTAASLAGWIWRSPE